MKKYTSMLCTSSKNSKVLTERHYNLPCVCLNKIHGMNIQVAFESNKGNDFNINLENIYTREDKLTIENDNYNAHLVLGPLFTSGKFNKLLNIFKEKYLLQDEICESFHLFGELFGGWYRHSIIPVTNMGCVRINKGVYYTPCNNILFFDIYIKTDQRECYLDWTVVQDLLTSASLDYPDIIFKGTLQECLDFNPVFIDPTYKKYGLPEIENNYSEGVVIRPIKESAYGYNFGGDRLILKNKHQKFSEKQKQHNKAAKEIFTINLVEFDLVSEYINQQRLDNCFSHLIIEKDIKNFPILIKSFYDDIIKDFKIDNDISHLSKEEEKALNKFINKKASELVKQFLLSKENI